VNEAPAVAPDFCIVSAWYGDPNSLTDPARGADVTAQCQAMITEGDETAPNLTIKATNAAFGDPCVGTQKMLTVQFNNGAGSTTRFVKAWEHESCDFERQQQLVTV
jgi:hypothetical protein